MSPNIIWFLHWFNSKPTLFFHNLGWYNKEYKSNPNNQRLQCDGFLWAFICSFLAWHLSMKAHQADVSVKKKNVFKKGPAFVRGFFWDTIMTKPSRAVLPLTLKSLHILLDVVSWSPWQPYTHNSDWSDAMSRCTCTSLSLEDSPWSDNAERWPSQVCVAVWSFQCAGVGKKVTDAQRLTGEKLKEKGGDWQTEKDIRRDRESQKGEMEW